MHYCITVDEALKCSLTQTVYKRFTFNTFNTSNQKKNNTLYLGAIKIHDNKINQMTKKHERRSEYLLSSFVQIAVQVDYLGR